jgi:DNA-binding TFAR19-related protein (PDSD5 family)
MSENEKHELEKIRLKKMKALMEAKKREEAALEKRVSIGDKLEYILKIVLSPDAYSYLNNLKQKEPNVYRRIYSELISPDVVENIDYLLSIIRLRGGVPRKIPKDAIIYLERKVKGIKSKIQVKRGDELLDLSSFLSKDDS